MCCFGMINLISEHILTNVWIKKNSRTFYYIHIIISLASDIFLNHHHQPHKLKLLTGDNCDSHGLDSWLYIFLSTVRFTNLIIGGFCLYYSKKSILRLCLEVIMKSKISHEVHLDSVKFNISKQRLLWNTLTNIITQLART